MTSESEPIRETLFGKDKPLSITVRFDNVGKTPAIHAQTCVVADIVESTKKDVDISCPEDLKSPGFGIVFPGWHLYRLPNATAEGGKTGGKTPVDPQGLLRAPLMKELRHWRKKVYVYGRVDYWDIFKKPHWTTFCSVMVIMPATAGGMPETINWLSCQTGNDADTEDEKDR
jgi:hypothetical protein